jgi:hypothetical protein
MGAATIEISAGAHATASGIIGDAPLGVELTSGYPRPKPPYKSAEKKHGEIEVGLGNLKISDENLFSESHFKDLKDPRYLEKVLKKGKSAGIKKVGLGVEFEIPAPIGKSHTVDVEHGGKKTTQRVENATLSVSLKVKGDGALEVHETYSASVSVRLPNGSTGTVTYGLDLTEKIKLKMPGPDWKKVIGDTKKVIEVAAAAAGILWGLARAAEPVIVAG